MQSRTFPAVPEKHPWIPLPRILSMYTPSESCGLQRHKSASLPYPEGTLALLSACKFLFKGKDLAIARDQIRMTIGCLKVLGEVWPRTARNVRELQTIGQYVLGVGSRESNSDASNPTPGLHALQGDGSRSSSTNVLSSDTDILSSISSIQDLCGWYGLGDLPDLPWGIGDGL
ncbi:hypothetical protein KXW10_006237 [Aspergillus fumigatus]|nr:hypothetical protein KXW10_006237 [Aspergillus fumigatus]